MPITFKKNERLEKLLAQKARLESELARAQKSQKAEARKLDSRRKIIVGAALQKAVTEGRIKEDFLRGLLATYASERDQKVFSEFDFSNRENRDDGHREIGDGHVSY